VYLLRRVEKTLILFLFFRVGLLVLKAACAQLKAWEQDSMTSGLSISVNVSAKQFKSAQFAQQVEEVVH